MRLSHFEKKVYRIGRRVWDDAGYDADVEKDRSSCHYRKY